MAIFRTIEWRDGMVRLLDQRRLPHFVEYIDYRDYKDLALAIKDMVVRGAPAIGASAAYGLALAVWQSAELDNRVQLVDNLAQAEIVLRAARPTAVNLSHALQRVMGRVRTAPWKDKIDLAQVVLGEAHAIAAEDILTNQQIGLNALPLVPQPATFIHHCNTGALATVDYGTAMGIIRSAHEHGRQVFVFVDETRPRLQGARLTAWELQQLGIPHAVIVDGASGYIMQTHQVDLVTVGCDRVSANGDTANKIGTYNLAIVARAHHVPFYVAAPTTTIDLSTPSGSEIEIEERDAAEVMQIGNERITPDGSPVINPAFDITPAEYITAIITEAGIAYPPFTESLPRLKKQRF